MRSLLYAILVGLLGAVVLHIVVILMVPVYSGLDAYARVLDLGSPGEFKRLPDKAPETALSVSGPFLKEAVCAFSTDDGPVQLSAEGDPPFWSIAVFDSGSNEAFSMNDRTSVNRVLNIVAGTEAQIAALRKIAPDNAANSIMVVLPTTDGYAVLRTLSPEKSLDPDAASFLNAASCNTFVPR
jgi:uncharacterized membrane protein